MGEHNQKGNIRAVGDSNIPPNVVVATSLKVTATVPAVEPPPPLDVPQVLGAVRLAAPQLGETLPSRAAKAVKAAA